MTDEVKPAVDPGKGVEIPGESSEGTSLSARDQQEIAVKDRAKSMGWMPRKEWQGDPGDWVSAREFLARQSFFDKIKSQSSEIRNLREDIKAMSQHFAQMKEVEYKRALAELKAERKDAINQGDTTKAESVSDQIVEIEAARKEIKQAPNQKSNYGQEEFTQFKERNKWYNTDPELTQRANALGMGYAQMNPSATPEQVLQYVEKEIKATAKRETIAPASPASGGLKSGPVKGNKFSESDLTDMQKKMMNTFVQRGVLTKEQYLESLSKAEGNRS